MCQISLHCLALLTLKALTDNLQMACLPHSNEIVVSSSILA